MDIPLARLMALRARTTKDLNQKVLLSKSKDLGGPVTTKMALVGILSQVVLKVLGPQIQLSGTMVTSKRYTSMNGN